MDAASTIISLVLALATPLMGGVLAGVDRKLTARMQERVGPPLLQPFYDVIKPVSYTHLTLPTILRV